MGTFGEELENVTRGLACLAARAGSGSAGVFSNAVRRLPGGEAVAAPAEDVAAAVERFVCPVNNGEGLSGVFFPSPFSGGQCATTYDWSVTTVETYSGGFPDRTTTITGTSSGPFVLQRLEASLAAGDSSSTAVGWNAADGVDPKKASNRNAFLTIKVTAATFTRVDGLPDDCGPGGGGESGDGTGVGYNGPITYDNGDGPITVDVNVTVDNPIIDEDGNLVIPFVYIDPDLELEPRIRVDVEPEFGGGGGGCGNRDYAPDLPDFPENDDDPEAPNSDTRYVGVVVSCNPQSEFPTVSEFGDGDVPNLYSPRLATIIFSVVLGNQSCWISPIDVRVRKQYVPVPGFIPASGWEVKSVNGWDVSVIGVPLDVPDLIVLA